MRKKVALFTLLALVLSSFSGNIVVASEWDDVVVEEIISAEEYSESNDVEEVVDEDTVDVLTAGLKGEIQSLGYHGVYLSEKEKQDKSKLHDYIDTLRTQDEGNDYEDNQIVFEADSEEEAIEIASCYNAKLVFYDYGIAAATIDFSDEIEMVEEIKADEAISLKACAQEYDIPICVEDVIEMAASSDNYLPAVYPNYIYEVEEEIVGSAGVLPKYSNDAYSDMQYAHHFIKDYKAWEKGITGRNVTVAIIDTGVNYNHIDISPNITEFRYNAIAADKRLGEQFGYYDKNNALDDMGHGSHCAGIVAAIKDNGVGITGVAPNCKIMPIKTMTDKGVGVTAWICAGINAAVKNGADILNLSLGSYLCSPLETKTINNAVAKGTVVVASAGNESTILNSYPATDSNVISVAALCPSEYPNEELLTESANVISEALNNIDLDQKLSLAYYSNYYPSVTIAAPGSAILSLSNKTADSYYYASGTSQAAPQISGVIALILSADNSLMELNSSTVTDAVKDIIKNSSDGQRYDNSNSDIYSDGFVDCGMINAQRAVDIALQRAGKISLEAPAFVYETNKDGTIKAGERRYLEIRHNNSFAGAEIYYTDNGKDPKKFGKRYSDPIKLDFEGKKTYKAVVKYLDLYSQEVVLKGNFKATIESISLNKYINLLPGKKAQIAVDYEPEFAQKPKFTFKSSNTAVVTVDKKGRIKANKKAAINSSSVITVTDSEGNVSASVPVRIVDKSSLILELPKSLTDGVVLAKEDTTIYQGNQQLSMNQILDLEAELLKAGLNIDDLYIKSSNPKVVRYKDGKLCARAKGKAKITVMTNDGSNKKKSFKVVVNSYVKSFALNTDTLFCADEINTVSSAIIGYNKCKVKLLPEFNEGKDAPSNKKLKFESSGAVVVSKSGVVKPAKNALVGSVGTVSATTTDGTNITRKFEFTIVEPIGDIRFLSRYYNTTTKKYDDNFAVSKKIKLNAHTGYTTLAVHQISNKSYNMLEVVGISGKQLIEIKNIDKKIGCISNDPENVIHFGQFVDHMFYFDEGGKKTITYITRDGSNKKLTLAVNVYD